ncbi:MAG: hypothetical protein WAN61_02255 [Minisyncoccia bacterium]
MKRDVLNSPRLTELKKYRRRAFWDKILFLLLGILIVFIFAIYLSRLNSLNISDIEISGNKVVDTEMIKTVAQRELAGKYFGLFPKSNILFYPQNKIKNGLQNQFQRLENINLSIQNNKILEISVEERTPEYLWCEMVPEKCYFVDDNGYIFDTAPYFSGDVYFKLYGGTDINADNPLGSYFLKQNFQSLISFKDMLEKMGLKPISLSSADNGDIQMSLDGGTASAPEIVFNMNSDLETVAENLETALTTEPLQSEFATKYTSLQYIDLRFGNKVYYKFSK